MTIEISAWFLYLLGLMLGYSLEESEPKLENSQAALEKGL